MSEYGWIYFNEDSGTEWSANHPVTSGEVPDATDVRPCTAEEHYWILASRADVRSKDDTIDRLRAEVATMREALTGIDTECHEIWIKWVKQGGDLSDAIRFVGDIAEKIRALSTEPAPSPITKEWCENMARLEGNAEIGAGVLARDPEPAPSPWRPISEAPQGFTILAAVTLRDGSRCSRSGFVSGDIFCIHGSFSVKLSECDGWMPMPEPPQGDA